MPRDAELVAKELTANGCELPRESLNRLAFRLMPDEAILGALLGRAAYYMWYGASTSKSDCDDVLLLLTDWRILAQCYKHARNRMWEEEFDNSRLWQGIVEVYGWEADEKTRRVKIGYGASPGTSSEEWWTYSSAAIDRDRFTNFINVGQRKLEAVKLISTLSYAPLVSALPDQLERLVALRQEGHLSEQEFDQAKRKLLFD